MTELEALRRVAEAARKWARWMDHRMADASFDFYCEVSFALEVLDALPEAAEPATPARSRLAALEALHAVVRDYETGNGEDVRWADVRAALAAVDDSPASAPEPEGEVVEVAVWRDNDDGEVVFCIPKTERDDPLQGWTRLGTTRLAVKKGEGA